MEIGIDMIYLDCRAICDLFPVLYRATSCPNMYDILSQIHVYKPATCLVQTPSFTVSHGSNSLVTIYGPDHCGQAVQTRPSQLHLPSHQDVRFQAARR